MKRLQKVSFLGFVLLMSLGCSSKQETGQAYVQNQFLNAPASIAKVVYQGVVVYEALPSDSLLMKGQDSASLLASVPAGASHAYALVAFGWQPGSPKPNNYVLVRTKDVVQTVANRAVPIVFSEPNHIGKCSSSPLSEAEYTQALNDYFKNDPVQKFSDVSCSSNPPPSGDSGTSIDASVSDTR